MLWHTPPSRISGMRALIRKRVFRKLNHMSIYLRTSTRGRHIGAGAWFNIITSAKKTNRMNEFFREIINANVWKTPPFSCHGSRYEWVSKTVVLLCLNWSEIVFSVRARNQYFIDAHAKAARFTQPRVRTTRLKMNEAPFDFFFKFSMSLLIEPTSGPIL